MHITLPNIYYFNPTCEMAIANGTVSWQPSILLQQFETDLELIAAFLAKPNDIVLMRKLPSNEHINRLKETGIILPKLITFQDAKHQKAFTKIKKREIKPWGWSPAMLHKIKPFIENCSTEFQESPIVSRGLFPKELYSRKIAAKILYNIISNNLPGVIDQSAVPQICYSTNELKTQHAKNKQSMIKAPWSSSGRGVYTITDAEIPQPFLNRCNKTLKQQNYLMVEPLFNKQLDFSFQFEITKSKVEYMGTAWFYTNDKNAYKGNYLKKEFANIPDECDKLLLETEHKIVQQLSTELEANYQGKYQGKLSVDAMFVNTNKKHLAIHPCVEINLRHNMSNVAQSLSYLSNKGYKAFEIKTIEAYQQSTTSKTLLLTEGEKFCACLKQ